MAAGDAVPVEATFGVDEEVEMEEAEAVEAGDFSATRAHRRKLSKLVLWRTIVNPNSSADGMWRIKFPTSMPVFISKTNGKSERLTRFWGRYLRPTLRSRWIPVF